VGAFAASTLVCNAFTLTLLPTLGLDLAFTLAALALIPGAPYGSASVAPPAWDIPARMLVATSFVFALTSASSLLGAQLSGLVAPFPIYATVLASFAHQQQGPAAARQLLRGVVFGSFAFISFFVVVAGVINTLGLGPTYLFAVLATLLVNACVLWFTRRKSKPVFKA